MKPVFFILFSTCVICAQQTPSASVSGFVFDESNGETLIGANVFLKPGYRGATSNSSGYYVIPRVEAGPYTIHVQYIGYKPYAREITVKDGEIVKLNIVLQNEAIESEEVVIYGDSLPRIEELYRRPISKLELTGVEIAKIPQVAEADLLRSLQTLPGVVSMSDFSSALYVRGGSSDQNLYLIDGTDVYNPEHAFGLFSTFNTDAIKKVELSKGGFGAEYGGRLSSVLNVTNLDGNREEFEGSGSLSLLSARTTLQMPIGHRGSISGSIRRTYFDKTIGAAINDIPDYYFWDGNVKAYFELDKKNFLTISGYGGQDVLGFTFNEEAESRTGFDVRWGNTTGSARWTRVFTPQLFGNFWVTGSRFQSKFEFTEPFDFSDENFVSDVTVKGSLEYYASERWSTRFGFEQKFLHGIFEQEFPDGRVDVNRRRRQSTAYAQVNYRPDGRWDIEPGVRFDYFDAERDYKNLDPRLTVRYRLTETSNLKAAAGIYHQYLHRMERPFFVGIWTSSDENQRESESKHLILGYQQQFAETYELEIEAYLKTYRNVYSLNQNIIAAVVPERYDEQGRAIYANTKGLFDRGRGNSQGLEFLLKKNSGAVTGWMALSWAGTRMTFDGINQDQPFPPRHDRTVNVNFVSSIDVKNGLRVLRGEETKRDKGRWIFGTNFIYNSGQPITVPSSYYAIRPTPDAGFWTRENPTTINKFRLPYYARLDISVSYLRQFTHWSFEPYLQIYNVGNRKNVWFLEYDGTKVDKISMFPILPTIGMNFKF